MYCVRRVGGCASSGLSVLVDEGTRGGVVQVVVGVVGVRFSHYCCRRKCIATEHCNSGVRSSLSGRFTSLHLASLSFRHLSVSLSLCPPPAVHSGSAVCVLATNSRCLARGARTAFPAPRLASVEARLIAHRPAEMK